MNENLHIVIMAGGIGSRFWPMSTPECPKQFIDVLGVGRTMIQLTAERLAPMCPAQNMWVVTSEKYCAIAHEQLPEVPVENLLAEPVGRNTAPCIAYACWKIKRTLELQGRGTDAQIVVLPSDALILDAPEYRRVLGVAIDFITANAGSIVTIGIKPTRPDTGYGYICSQSSEGPVLKVEAFKEKPTLPVAQEYLASGNYLWNAGIFVWSLSTITNALRAYAPQICGIMDAIDFCGPAERADLERLFPECEKISIDYAVMEKHPGIYTIPGDFGWSDLGTWGSLRQNSQKDSQGNAVVSAPGVVSLYDSANCVAHISNLSKVVVCGLDGYIVAEKNGKLLICPLDQEQRIKEFDK